MAAEIFGTIYEDVDRSGTKTNGDNGLSGWTVFLDLNKDGALNAGEPSEVTNVDGDYSINGLAGGNYRVTELVPAGWTPITATSRDVAVETNKKANSDFFVFAGGDISGVVWSDVDHDGVRSKDPSSGEFTDPALSGWTIYLDLNQSTTLDAGEPTTVTDADGAFRFADLAPGDYEVTEVLPTGWEATKKHDIRQTATVVGLQETAIEFGNYSLTNGGIRGAVFNDVNADGIRNIDPSTGLFVEPGLEGWTVYLDLNHDLTLDATDIVRMTDSDGEYNFVSLDAGDYDVIEVLPLGWDVSAGSDSKQTVSVTAADVSRAIDFANFTVLNGSISGLIWNDVNRNGVRDFNVLTGLYSDPPLTGWSVFVDLNRNRVADEGEPVSVTNASGQYQFLDLQIGDYEVQEILPTGWEVAATFNDSQTVTVFSGADSVAGDFANYDASASAPGSVAGAVWDDVNGNGIHEPLEPGLAGWTVFHDLNSNGVLDTGESQLTTPADGSYLFAGVSAGTVSIGVLPTAGWQATAPASNNRSLTLRGGQNATGLDFGEVQLKEASISGSVFSDANKNGLRDAGEHGLAGITVYLDLNNNNAIDPSEPSLQTSSDQFYTPTVDEAGDYSFTHLALGTYVVRTIVPDILSATPAGQLERTISISAFENRTGVNTAAVYRPNEIRGTKFDDQNGNHVRDAGEPAMVGATIFVDIDRDDTLDDGEPTTTTSDDGSYAFVGLPSGSYVVRSVVSAGYSKSSPTTTGGILWPSGTSNPAVGNVSPLAIETSLAKDQSYLQTVSITLPNTGALTDLVDVFLLFDDTGSFVNNSPIVRAAFPDIIAQLQSSLPGIDLGFGVGRFEEYANFAYEYSSGRPFILNQPIVAASTAGYMTSIQAALNRTTPGYGGDGPETDIEALYQLVTGRGFDGNNNGTTLDSGPAGLSSTQLSPGISGDVPSFASFTADPANSVLPAAGTIGGAGFRSGALPIVLLATDIGLAYQPKGEVTVTGAGGVSLPVSALTQTSRATTPFNSGAGLQETITGLNALGALVIGLGTNAVGNVDPRQQLEAISKLTGTTNQTSTTIANGTADPIAPGDPLYFQIASGFGASVANGVVSAIQNAVTNVAVDIEVRASDPRVRLVNHSGVAHGIGSSMTASFSIEFIGDGSPHRFDLQFVRAGTNVVLGSIPVVLGTPITGDYYHFDEVEDGEIEVGDDFSDNSSSSATSNAAPTFVMGANVSDPEDIGSKEYVGWATSISAGPASESGQSLTFIVNNDHASLFASQPTISPNGTLSFATAADANGIAVVTVALQDDGGTANGGVDTSALQTFTITITPVNDAPTVVQSLADLVVLENASDTLIDLSSIFADIDDVSLDLSVISSDSSIVTATITGKTLTLSYAAGANGVANITVTATDSGLLTASESFRVEVGNSLPTLSVSSPLDGFLGVAGQSRIVRLTASDASNNGTRPFQYEVLWGDGSPLELYSGGSDLEISHTYHAPGTATASFRAIDPDGGASGWETSTLSIQRIELQGARLAIGGNDGNDSLTVTPTVNSPIGNLRLNALSLGDLAIPVDGVHFFGGLGNDTATLIGTIADDVFTVDGENLSWNGSATWPLPLILNSADVETQKVVAQAGNDEIHVISGNAIIDGGTGVDRVFGPSIDTNWEITGTGIGSLNGFAFTGVDSLVGGTASDRFKFASAGKLLGSIEGGIGTDQLDYSARATAVTVNLSTNTATAMVGVNGIEAFVAGNASTDTITAPNIANLWSIGADGTTHLNTGTEIRGFETLKGGSDVDVFTIGLDVVTSPSLIGGLGVDVLNYADRSDSIVVNRSARSATSVPSFNQIEQFIGGSGIDTLIGADARTNWTLSDGNSGTFSGGGFASFERVQGGSSDDSFTVLSDSVATAIAGGDGLDTLRAFNAPNSWSLRGVASGDVNGTIAFTGVENITGGTSSDDFYFDNSASGFGAVVGGPGFDTFDYSALPGPIAVNLATLTSPGLTRFATIESIQGTAASDTLVGPDRNTNWSIKGTASGSVGAVAFQAFENLVGGSANDRFLLLGGSVDSIIGGLGVDTLIGDSKNNEWIVSGTGAGSLNATLTYDELENLTGGSLDDLFEVEPTGSVTGLLNGGIGTNTLSYARWNTDVSINTVQGTASAVGGLSANFSILIGGSGNDSLTAFVRVPSVLIGNGGNDLLTGSTAGRDLLFGGQGVDSLNGLGGDDILFGGQTSYDNSPSILKDLHAEWRSTRTYQQRINNLRGGPITGIPLNGEHFLANHPVDTLLDDSAVDTLVGGTWLDWFIKATDDILADLAIGEWVDSPTE